MAGNQFSFKGWKLKEWYNANKSNIRLIAAAFGGFLVTQVDSLQDGPLKVLLAALATVGIKLVLDSVDYFLSE